MQISLARTAVKAPNSLAVIYHSHLTLSPLAIGMSEIREYAITAYFAHFRIFRMFLRSPPNCEKNSFPCGFLVRYLSRFSAGLHVTFCGDFNAKWLKQCVFATLQPLVLLWGLSDTIDI